MNTLVSSTEPRSDNLQAWQAWLDKIALERGEGYRMRMERLRREMQAIRREAVEGRPAREFARAEARRAREWRMLP